MTAAAGSFDVIPSWAIQLQDLAVRRVRDDPGAAPWGADWLEQKLRDATHVHVQNVAEYFWVHSEREEWSANLHVASARCPWKAAWFTFRRPAVSNRGGRLEPVGEAWRDYVGMLHWEVPEGGRFLAHSLAFLLDRPELRHGHFWEMRTILDEGGGVVPEAEYFSARPLGVATARHLATFPPDVVVKLRRHARINRMVALLSCAFANCKNVEAVERTYVPHSKKVLRRGDYKGRRYYVLAIIPVATPRSPRRESPDPAAGVSYHICRGHFADYSKGRGLFGRYHDRFWIPQHARGSRAVGEVVKDYAVVAPAGGAA